MLETLSFLYTSYREYSKLRGTAGQQCLQDAVQSVFQDQKFGQFAAENIMLPRYMLLEVTVLDILQKMGLNNNPEALLQREQALGMYKAVSTQADVMQDLLDIPDAGTMEKFQAEVVLRIIRELARRGNDSQFRANLATLLAPLAGVDLVQQPQLAIQDTVLDDDFDLMLDELIEHGEAEVKTSDTTSSASQAGPSDDQLPGSSSTPDTLLSSAPLSNILVNLFHICTAETTHQVTLETSLAALDALENLQTADFGDLKLSLKGTLSLPAISQLKKAARSTYHERQTTWQLLVQMEDCISTLETRKKAVARLQERIAEVDVAAWSSRETRSRFTDDILAATASGSLLLLDTTLANWTSLKRMNLHKIGVDFALKFSEMQSVQSLCSSFAEMLLDLVPLSNLATKCILNFSTSRESHLLQFV